MDGGQIDGEHGLLTCPRRLTPHLPAAGSRSSIRGSTRRRARPSCGRRRPETRRMDTRPALRCRGIAARRDNRWSYASFETNGELRSDGDASDRRRRTHLFRESIGAWPGSHRVIVPGERARSAVYFDCKQPGVLMVSRQRQSAAGKIVKDRMRKECDRGYRGGEGADDGDEPDRRKGAGKTDRRTGEGQTR